MTSKTVKLPPRPKRVGGSPSIDWFERGAVANYCEAVEGYLRAVETTARIGHELSKGNFEECPDCQVLWYHANNCKLRNSGCDENALHQKIRNHEEREEAGDDVEACPFCGGLNGAHNPKFYGRCPPVKTSGNCCEWRDAYQRTVGGPDGLLQQLSQERDRRIAAEAMLAEKTSGTPPTPWPGASPNKQNPPDDQGRQ